MGWWTLGGKSTEPMEDRVSREFASGADVLRIERRGTAFHLLVKCSDGVTRWGVALVENGMVKTMDESMGPYCAACSPAFYRAAVDACGEAPCDFAREFRARMAPAPSFVADVSHITDADGITRRLSRAVRVF